MLIYYMNFALLIPLYEPSEDVIPFLKSIPKNAFEQIIVVNDGSDSRYQMIFDEINKFPCFHVISYEENHGKGYALKKGIEHIRNQGDIDGIITADGDGQHSIEDILKIRDELALHPTNLVLGVRSFDRKTTPMHNRLGNNFSALYFKLATGVKLNDTQTGLRGIPKNLYSLCLDTRGNRYEYEMAFLLDAVKENILIQVPIATIYKKNQESHFRPFIDSVRIYKVPLIYIAIALLSFGIDLSLFYLFSILGPSDELYKILVATIGARLVSGGFNFIMNYFVAFNNRGYVGKRLTRYLIIFFINMGLSFGLTYLFDYLLPSNIVFIKFIVDFFLFIINYFIARGWIFAKKQFLRHERD